MIIYSYGIHSFMPGRIRKFFRNMISELGLKRGYMSPKQAESIATHSLKTAPPGREITRKARDASGNVIEMTFRKMEDTTVRRIN